MHLGRAARERNVFYCDSLISRAQAVQCLIFYDSEWKSLRSGLHGGDTHAAQTMAGVGTHSHSTSKTGGQLDLLLPGPSGNLSALGRLRPLGIATAR